MTTTRYLVTGGAGFIGSAIAEALLRRGERVRVIDDLSTGRRSNLEVLARVGGDRVEVIEASVVDAAAIDRACKGIEVVFHHAALPSVPKSVEAPLVADRANTHGTLSVLEGARANGVRRVIYAGSSAAYGDDPTLPKVESMLPTPLSPYAVGKLAGEHYVSSYARLHGMETLVFRYFNVFGPRQDPNGAYAAVIPRWIDAALSKKPIVIYGDGQQTRDFCHVDNIVAANLLAASTSRTLRGETVNLSCGEAISLLELADAIAAEAGHPVERRFEPTRTGDVKDSLADITRVRSLLDFEPKVRWREGLAATITTLREASRATSKGA
jgi:UDP-glucose 4-epimerase